MKAWLEQLHTGAAWYALPPEKQTGLQRLAARTLGVVTPSNIITVGGALMVVVGLLLFYNKSYLPGLILIGLGRCFDLLDGYVARKTHTSSPFGEGLDASSDKVVIGFTAIILLVVGVLPLLIGLLFLLEEAGTALLTLMSRRQGVTIHPTRLGKYTTFAVWIVVGLYLVSYWLRTDAAWQLHNASAGSVLYWIASLLGFIIIVFRGLALSGYATVVRQKSSTSKRKS